MLLPQYKLKPLKTPASIAEKKNTFDAENLSDMVRMANKNVPMIKPNCTAEVSWPNADSTKLKFRDKSEITALPANQSEVQQN